MGYTNSPLVVYTKLSPNHSGQRTHSIDRITPHCVVGQLSAESICGCFTSTSRQASCNYGIGTDGRVSLCVEEKNRSWCSSSNANDQRAVTIECASDMNEPYAMNSAVYSSLIKLCTDICRRNGKKKLLWLGDKNKTLNYVPAADEMVLTVHRWFANKSCPGNWLYARLGDLAAKVTAALGGSSSSGMQASSLKNLSEAEAVAKIGPLFTANQKTTGILACVSMAQFILESGYGKSELAQNANNCFGMKTSLSGNSWSGSSCVRQLRQQNPPVGVYFEKENIDTLDATGELILTILSALAQDESRSISDNIRWSIQKNFQAGKPKVDLNRMLGYDKGANGEWVINPEQAKTVRYIFERYVCGQTANRIAKELNELGRKTVNKKNWSASSVLTVLRNEKYVGDIEMQKTITKDFLTHRSTINKGEAPRYYVENHHVGIIDRSTWDKAQTMLYEKPSKVGDSVPAQKKKRGYTGSPFGNLVCGAVLEHGERAGKECGEGFFRVTYTGVATGYTDDRSLAATGGDTDIYLEKYAYAYPVWRCKQKMGKREGEKPRQNGTPDQKLYCREKHGRLSDAERKAANERCPSESIHECALEQSFMEMLYRLKRDYEKNHEASEISTLFHKACEQMYQQMKGNSVSVERLETLDAQIKELEEKLQETIGRQVTAMRDAVLEQNLELNESLAEGNITLDEIDSDIRNGLTGNDIGTSFYHADYEEGSEIEAYASLAKDIRQRIESFRKEKETLSQEQGALTVMKKNFDLFIACLKELPEQNAAGMPLKVNGLDVQGSLFRDVDGKPVDGAVASLNRGRLKMTPERIAEAPDLLHFEKGIYCAFMKKGTVKGDIVLYETNFGVTLPTCGNQRTLTSFLGFKKCSLDGLVTLVDAPYRVYDNTVQYRRYLRSKAKREQAV